MPRKVTRWQGADGLMQGRQKVTQVSKPQRCKQIFHSALGRVLCGDSLRFLRDQVEEESVDLIVTSPPFGLVRKKEYGNVEAHDYVAWFKPFGVEFKRVLKPSGSFVIDIGGAWISGQPTRSLYHYELLIMLCKEVGFHLAQEFFWWNPSKLPTPAEWVTIRRIRVKDAVDCVWWLSRSPWPKASNTRVLQPYSDSMKSLLKNGYQAKVRPSGHDISDKFGRDNGAAIPPNLIAIAHTESNSHYLRYCAKHDIKPHPARFPEELPEYFIRMLTDPGDVVVDPFAGSCVSGEVAERLSRKWVCVEIREDYIHGALGRFIRREPLNRKREGQTTLFGLDGNGATYYKIPRPDSLWHAGNGDQPLSKDGGKSRRKGE